jgi:hypothetical protein
MKKFMLLSLLVFGGCALAQQVPSLRYCDKVEYKRYGREIDITAHCFEAIEPAFPVPIPKP